VTRVLSISPVLASLAAFVACSGSPEPTARPPSEAVAISRPSGSAVAVKEAAPPPREVRLFMMSHCPYAAAMIPRVGPILRELGERVTLRADFIGTEADGTLKSMFKEEGVEGDVAMRCVEEHSPRWLEIFECQVQDRKNAARNWRACGARFGLSTDRVQQCIESGEGRALLKESYAAAKTAGATGSPTLLIDGAKYQGSRRVRAVREALCEGLAAPTPPLCVGIPPPPEVAFQVLTDSRCTDCGAERLENSLQTKFEAPVVGPRLDYMTPEGRAAFERVKPAELPVALFDASLDRDPEAEDALGTGLKTAPSGARYMTLLGVGGWNPVCADDGGCSLDECSLKLQCRKERPRTLELAFMSKCPFYAKGIVALKEVVDHLRKRGETVSLRVEAVGETKNGELVAIHGPREVAENLRHLCVAKKYAARLKYLDYFVCRAADQTSDDWEKCTGGKTGFDAKAIRTCAEGPEGKALLTSSNDRLGKSNLFSSPTWVVNDKFKHKAIDSTALLGAICEHNKLKSCAAELATPPVKTSP
jgi:2-hydroxychromene-2-carboxylate isomerase